MPETTVIERKIFIALPPQEVFRYLVEPALMSRWIGISHELDLRPGGCFRLELSKGNVARGRYREVAPPRRIAFTWGWESGDSDLAALPPGSSLVEIDLEPSAGGTLVRLRHSRLPASLGDRHGERWSFYLAELARAAVA
jgi:uncharacterized protein YndB with AHSA1/START domain